MNKKNILFSTIIILLIIIGLISIANTCQINIDSHDDGGSIEILGLPIIHNNNEMTNEINSYCKKELTNENSTKSTIKNNITNIAKRYGYKNVKVNFHSVFGDNTLSILCKVSGTSMEPTFHNGEYVIVNKTKNIHKGDCVIADTPEYGTIIKRVSDIKGQEVYLTSDNKKISYENINGEIYKTEGIKTWTDINNIIGIAYPKNSTNS
ncbi:MAG: S24/S26 family peptidase [Methanobrevibacter wolinii]|nr:S24/S26 family peptidase [Methanobrevibacter wolinii]